MPSDRSLVVGLLVLALFVGGAGFVVHQYRFVTSAPTATGTVLHSHVDSYRRVGEIHLSGNAVYRANDSYAYVVDGRRYVGPAAVD
ncbi:MAG: hypothetical protein ABEJ28_02895 [Salinigranum sp.]